MLYTTFIAWVILEVAWDWYHMEKLNKGPNYHGSNLIRCIVGMVIWAAAPTLKEMDQYKYLMWPVVMFVSFWFLFDWWLNLVRTWSGNYRPYWYLGDNTLDRWQKRNGGAFAWFWIKGLLFIICLTIFEVIL